MNMFGDNRLESRWYLRYLSEINWPRVGPSTTFGYPHPQVNNALSVCVVVTARKRTSKRKTNENADRKVQLKYGKRMSRPVDFVPVVEWRRRRKLSVSSSPMNR